VLALAVPAHAAETQRARWFMGTACTAVVESADTTAAAAAAVAIGAAFDEIARLERVMSSWRDDSELSRMNREAAGPNGATCSRDLADAVALALESASETNGAFDPSIEPLNAAWDLRGRGRVPSRPQCERALALVGWNGVHVDRAAGTVRFERSGMGLDLGGIGKGIALDRARDVLRAHGVARGVINFGGEILAFGGTHAIDVADPADRLRAAVTLTASDAAVSTSAQSERGVDVRGVHYGHVLDPRTGRPVPTRASVTVVARSASEADARSTALLVMGRSEAERFASAHPNVGGVWLVPPAHAGGASRMWTWNPSGVSPVADAAIVVMNPVMNPASNPETR
jgi:thiamine biosynthesis lipoprotein